MCKLRDDTMSQAGELPMEKKMEQMSRPLASLSGAAVRGEAVEAARAVMEEKWDAEGACDSCGWHACLYEHRISDEDIAEALLFGGKIKIHCISKDDDDCYRHRGVSIDINPVATASARAADAPSEPDYIATIKELGATAWRDQFWKLASALNCLPSTFLDGNDHVFKAVELLKSRAADALDSQPTDPYQLLRAAFTTAESGADGYFVKFKFPTMEAMQAAHMQWHGVAQPTVAAQQGSIADDARFAQMMRMRTGLDTEGKTFKDIVAYIDSRAPAAQAATKDEK